MATPYTSFICLHLNKSPLFLVEDADNCIHRMTLTQFLDAMCFPHTQIYKRNDAPHIICLRAMERDPKNFLNVDFAIHTFVNMPESLNGTTKLWNVYWMLWEGLDEKMPAQP